MPEPQLPQAPLLPRIIFGVVGSVFALIGITVIVGMWSMAFNDFHSPPLFFRIFASLIAVCFVAVGGVTAFGAITGKMAANPTMRGLANSTATGYTCPQCGATLGKDAEVSPMGDVKCSFCQQWFNIHQKTAS